MKKDNIVARITIKGPGKMTPDGRKRIAAWLRRHAADLIKEGPNYTGGVYTGKYLVAPCLSLLLLASVAAVAQDKEDPCGTVLAPKGCVSLTSGAVTVATRDQRREFVTVGGAFSGPYRGFRFAAAADMFGVQDGEAIALGKEKAFRVVKLSGVVARNWNALSFGLRAGLTYSIEGEQGAPIDPRMLDLKGQVELQLEKQGHITLWCGHDGSTGGGAFGVDISIPVAGGPAIVAKYELPFYRNPYGQLPWVITGGGSVRIKSFSLYH